jgi:hypothetical protein
MASETKPFVVATPKSKLAAKSATPIKMRTGTSERVNRIEPRYLKRITRPISKVEVLIVVMVMSALDSEPIAINIRQVPKKRAAPIARRRGLSGTPCETSGPLARNPPRIARTTPREIMRES